VKSLSDEQTRELLENYRTWALDDPPDYAQVNYYTICPDFVGIIKRGSRPAYCDRQAWLVEEVLRTMFDTLEYGIIQRYYGKGWTESRVAKWLGVPQSRMSDSYLPAARDAFARNWLEFSVERSRNPWS